MYHENNCIRFKTHKNKDKILMSLQDKEHVKRENIEQG